MILYMTEITVARFPEALAWFRDVLGLCVELNDEARQFALLRSGEARIGLTARKVDAPVVQPRLTFLVEDLDAASSRFGAIGARTTEIVEDQAERFRSFRLEGPEGIPITVFAWTS